MLKNFAVGDVVGYSCAQSRGVVTGICHHGSDGLGGSVNIRWDCGQEGTMLAYAANDMVVFGHVGQDAVIAAKQPGGVFRWNK